jgi:hypothetical protein
MVRDCGSVTNTALNTRRLGAEKANMALQQVLNDMVEVKRDVVEVKTDVVEVKNEVQEVNVCDLLPYRVRCRD